MSPLAVFQGMRSRTLIVGIVALLGMVAVGYTLHLIAPENPSLPPESSLDLLLPSSLVTPQPKPGDRFMFIGIVLAAPICLLGVLTVARRLNITRAEPASIFLVLLTFIGFILAVKGGLGFALSVFGVNWIIVAPSFVGALAFVLAASRWPAPAKSVFFGAAVSLACAITFGLRVWTVHNVDYHSWFTAHGEAVLFSMMAIASGNTCLVESIPQYGCYGEFLAPIFHTVGLSVLSMTAVLSLLQVISVISVMFIARSLILTPALLAASLLSLIIAVVLNLIPANPDPILQYYPIRFMFPALSVVLICWLQDRINWTNACATGAFGGAAIAWNLESGLAVAIALTLFVGLCGLNLQSGLGHQMNLKQRLGRMIVALIGSGIFLSCFLTYLAIKSGSHVDLQNYFAYQTTFYFTGFGMILIPPFPDYWTIHAAILFAVLVYAGLVIACQHTVDRGLERAAYLALLAIGLTLYYTGRSHVLVLKLVAWPDAILFFFLADRTLRALVQPSFDKGLLFAKTLAVAIPSAYLAFQIPSVWRIATTPRGALAARTQVEEDIAFIREHTHPGERITIFGYEQSTLHAETGTSPALRGPSVAEMLLKADLAELQKNMIERGPEKMFIGAGLETASREGQLGTDLSLNFKALTAKYALAAWGPGKRVMELRRKPFNGQDLFTAESKVSTK